MTATLTITGTIDEIIALAAVLKVGRAVAEDAGRVAVQAPPNPIGLTPYEAQLVSRGEFIPAIKEVRARLNCGLKEAKDFVEASPQRKSWLMANP